MVVSKNKKPQLASGRPPRWAFMERFEIPNYDGDGIYLTRWRLIQTPLFGIYLHRFTGPDPRPTLHDHPWRFLSIILRGGYTERRLDPMTMKVDEYHDVKRVNYMPHGGAHSITKLMRNPTWTLMLVGRRVRTWGYLEPRQSFADTKMVPAWVWTEFNKHRYNDEFLAALERRKEE